MVFKKPVFKTKTGDCTRILLNYYIQTNTVCTNKQY